MARISHLSYYPVKGLRGIPLERVEVTENSGFPSDRRFAIADDSTPIDPAAPCHLKKQQLVVQMKYERLAQLKTRYDPLTVELTLSTKDSAVTFALNEHKGKADCEAFLTDFMRGLIKGKAQLITAPGISFTDLSTPCISLINLNSVKALEDALDYQVDPARFRANIYLEDLPAWEEESWLEKTLTINGTELLVYKITDRCAAINVNPETAERDQMLQGLKRKFGHLNMGVYAKVIKGGEIRASDSIDLKK